jgi:hypothetical protein
LERLEKGLVPSDNHGISVPDLHVHEGPVIVGQDMKRGWSVKPSLAPRKVEGLGSIAKVRHGTGKETAYGAIPCSSMKHRQTSENGNMRSN